MKQTVIPFILVCFLAVPAFAQEQPEPDHWIGDIQVTHTDKKAKKAATLLLISFNDTPEAADIAHDMIIEEKVAKRKSIFETQNLIKKYADTETLLRYYETYQKFVDGNDLFNSYALITDSAENFDKIPAEGRIYLINFFSEPFLRADRPEEFQPLKAIKQDGMIHLTLKYNIKLVVDATMRTIHLSVI